MTDVTVTVLPERRPVSLPAGSTGTALVKALPKPERQALVLVVNGDERDLGDELPDGAEVEVVQPDSDRGRFTLRHSTAHVLAQAVLELWPGATFAIGPPIDNGFYYDFELPNRATFSDDDLERIDAKMREIVKARQPFVRAELTPDEGRALFAQHAYKLAIIDGVEPDEMSGEGGVVSTYRNSDAFVDLCRGPHVPDTGRLAHFKLQRVAGAYWRGSEKNPMLQRIYGTAWESAKALQEHLHRLEEAEKRDHRKLGLELDLFSFPDEIGSGLAVFHPKGGLVRRLMEDYSRQKHEEGGYSFVNSPHITKQPLFETSGHLEQYADAMFPPMELDGGTNYYLKPMNCPFHNLIYRSRQRSYRDLPMRLFEFGSVYRYEKSGALQGLMRVRGMTQDDAHIYVTPDQLPGELETVLHFVLDLLRDYGLTDFYLELSTKPDKAIGSDDDWNAAIEVLREAALKMDLELVMDPGGGAFYGPKISVQARDAIGRTHQLSTVQVDFQIPQRFELEFVGADNARHRPVVIHRALFGSIERFFAILLEHFAGAFPTWLSPIQVRVLGVRDDHNDYASSLVDQLVAAGFRADWVAADEKLGNRIRRAKNERIPYVLVVGDDDVAAGTAGVNPRGGDVQRGVAIADFVEKLQAEVASRAVAPA